MDLSLSDEQQALVGSFTDLLSKHASIERVRAAEPGGFDAVLWAAPAGDRRRRDGRTRGPRRLGCRRCSTWPSSPSRSGATVAPAPVIETQVAARLLARLDGDDAAAPLAAALAGERLVTLAVRPASARRGRTRPCRGGRRRRDRAHQRRPRPRPARRQRPPARRQPGRRSRSPTSRLGRGTVLAGNDAADAALETGGRRVAGADGVGARRHRQPRPRDDGASTPSSARPWDVPIGTYQGVAHPLADDATAIDGARLLARKAAWEADGGGARARGAGRDGVRVRLRDRP